MKDFEDLEVIFGYFGKCCDFFFCFLKIKILEFKIKCSSIYVILDWEGRGKS